MNDRADMLAAIAEGTRIAHEQREEIVRLERDLRTAEDRVLAALAERSKLYALADRWRWPYPDQARESMCLAAVSERYGLTTALVHRRYHQGLRDEALIVPPQPGRPLSKVNP